MTDTTDDIAEEISFQSFEDDCKLLGSLLNDVLQRELGPQFMEKVERNRILAQSACNMRMAGIEDTAELLEKQMASEISQMTLEEALTLARTFSHYLNLMAIAETHHRVRKARNAAFTSKSCHDTFNELIQGGVSPDDLFDNVSKQVVEIVLTAHPTQINRRTLQYKHIRIAHLLEYNERPDLSHEDRETLIEDLVREITSIWQTDELRRHKPTPVDEARAGLHIVEQSLWNAVPHYLRRVSNALKKHTGRPLPLTCTPIKFGSWMGGDRDGNPNVTSKVTREVSLLSRWMAMDLYIREVDSLRFELSMNTCSDRLSSLAHDILQKERASEAGHESLIPTLNKNQLKSVGQQALAFPTQLPDGAGFPSCREYEDRKSLYHIRQFPGSDHMASNSQDRDAQISVENGNVATGKSNACSSQSHQASAIGKSHSFTSSQLLAQRKLFADSQIGRTSFHKLLEPSPPPRPGIAPYRVVLGDVKEKLMRTQKRLELLIGDLPCDHDLLDYYETSYQLLEPLLLCYDSLQSSGVGVLADGRLVDLIRRVATFGMVLMKLDLRQESGRHVDTLGAISKYLGVRLAITGREKKGSPRGARGSPEKDS